MPLLRSARRLRSYFGELPEDYAEESHDEEIPQVDIDEMVDLANELMRNGSGTAAGIRVRPRNIQLARDIILEHERRAANGTPRRLDDRPLWMKVLDSVTITLFPIIFIRIVKNLLSVSSFSIDVVQDTFDYIEYVQGTEPVRENSSLLMKFGQILMAEFPGLSNNVLIVLTLVVFYVYTILFSMFMVTSFAFLILCLTWSLGKRWQSIEKLVMGIIADGEGCI
ncbi:hypothetical protein KL936_004011 [Ogataea polymorpha]|nr:hypothetical protein KL936_004011 [Ogataea polymorpha]